MSSIFSKIIEGKIPAYKIAEDDDYIAILDAFPLIKGHTLVIPKVEIDNLFDLESNTYNGLLVFTKKVATCIQSTILCKRVSMHVIGLEVPHAHIHLIPINTTNDCNFANPKLKFTSQEFEAMADLLSSNFKKLN